MSRVFRIQFGITVEPGIVARYPGFFLFPTSPFPNCFINVLILFCNRFGIV